MSISNVEFPPQLDEKFIESLKSISFPTIGHYLETGFCNYQIRRMCGVGRVIGQAVTVRLTAQDSTLLHHTVSRLRANDVLVIDTGGDVSHAPVGLVVATAAKVRNAAGIIVDGVVTDLDEVAELGIPVYAKGTSILTTKLLAQSEGGLNVPITCGGVHVNSGDVVLADTNGVLILPQKVIRELLPTIIQDDADEPLLLNKLLSGSMLGEESGATDLLQDHLRSE